MTTITTSTHEICHHTAPNNVPMHHTNHPTNPCAIHSHHLDRDTPKQIHTLTLILLIAMRLIRNKLYMCLSIIVLLFSRFATNAAFVFEAGYGHNCAMENNEIKCWGRNVDCELGCKDGSLRGDNPNEMGDKLLVIDFGSDFIPTQLTTGAYHSCAISTENRVKCWGSGSYGKMGRGSSTSDIGCSSNDMGDGLLYIDLGSGFQTKQIMGGRYSTCALSTTNAVKCWGRNDVGELGLGDTNYRGDASNEMGDHLPEVDLGSFIPNEIMNHGSVACAISTDKKVKCWGRGSEGQLGLGDNQNRGDGPNEMGDNLPEINFGTNFVLKQLVGGRYHVCALSTTNTVKCWGQNTYGELGIGDTSDRTNPSNVPEIDFGAGFVPSEIGSAYYHSCALSTTNEVKCWGRNHYGQLGYGDTRDRGGGPNEMGDSLPVVNLGSDFTPVSIAVGGYHVCAISATKDIKCWGRNEYGTLGIGDSGNRGDGPNEMGDNLPNIDLGTNFIATGSTTKSPSQSPTMHPTKRPTRNPTSSPTFLPSDIPTVTPSRAPTPRPTGPSLLSCGQQAIGDYNDEALQFFVRLPYTGDLTFDASSS
eukprot:799212_1